jgi:hypothetical protein
MRAWEHLDPNIGANLAFLVTGNQIDTVYAIYIIEP